MQRIRIIRKLAAVLNDVDLSGVSVGDIVLLPEAAAVMLIREGWAALPSDGLVQPLENVQETGDISQVITDHREGKKDRLA